MTSLHRINGDVPAWDTGRRSGDVDQAAVLEVLDASAMAIAACRGIAHSIVAAADCIAGAFEAGHKLLVCGNGGSAADAQHLAAELMGQFLASSRDRAPRPAIALSADGALLTCIGNDFGFDEIFARQVRGLAQTGDVLFAISTSGSSPNVLRAFEAAPVGVVKIALCGPRSRLSAEADLAMCVPCVGTAAIQAAHIAIIHALCTVLESRFAASLR